MIYIDDGFKCHISNPDGTLREVQIDFFDGKCKEFIEGYCYDDSDGYVRIYPWHAYSELDQAQREYEKELYEQQKLLINELEQQAMAAKILLGVE